MMTHQEAHTGSGGASFLGPAAGQEAVVAGKPVVFKWAAQCAAAE